ncbi:Ca-activated chloride channel family protein [Fodinibius salinus]|uniref:Ca-activated chloride channel family protein n=1 Tax=Fodinibius salinus TaxID=860790 RepID=A0A5D3YPH6_9BACT|nr:VWA domain-containing protein [Fodinibius salinus]TYP95612.1 Ca-activated chloride channel family protein [Fodinibius salinus]
MIWQDGLYLWFLLLIPLLIAASWWYNKQLNEKRISFFGSDLFERLRSGFWPLGKGIKHIAIYIGIGLLIIAAAGPKLGTEVREVKRQGVDLLVALDLSASMNAEDVKPSRLEKAKYEVTRLIERLDGDRVGLVVFTGEAYLQAPMTLDYSALRLFLNIAETKQMPSSSTDFSAAMETASEAFGSIKEDKGGNAAKVMLIISDGENHGESYSSALQQLRDQNVSIYTLGIGTSSGSRIPLYGDSGSLMGYKRNEDGEVVTTKLQPDVLRSIAEEGNGEYYEIRSGGSGIDSFLGRLDELQQGEFASQEYADYKNQYQWLAAIGLLFMLFGMVFPKFKIRD